MLFYSDSGIGFLTYKLNVPCDVTDNLDEYFSSKDSNKIAILFDKTDIISEITNASTAVFNYETELHSLDKKYCTSDNLYWALPGILNPPTDITNTCFNGGWLESTAHRYRNSSTALNNLIDNINPLKTKPLMFDCLLGAKRKHRDFVYNKIIENNLSHCFYLTYYNSTITTDNFHLEPGTTIPSDTQWSNREVEYYGTEILLSQIVPRSIYDQTAYSIVAETYSHNDFSFFTEKLAKPILAKRLFVVFSGHHYLKNLRLFGFQTFGDIIDESYDAIEDDNIRFEQAFNQVKRLCSMDQQSVLAKIQPIVEHNYNVLMNCSWKSQCDDWVISTIKEKVKL